MKTLLNKLIRTLLIPIQLWLVVPALLLAAVLHGVAGPPSAGHDPRRWKSSTEPEPNPRFMHVLHPPANEGAPAPGPIDWELPHVAVYSVPVAKPPHATLKDLTESGQAHAIDLFEKQKTPIRTLGNLCSWLWETVLRCTTIHSASTTCLSLPFPAARRSTRLTE